MSAFDLKRFAGCYAPVHRDTKHRMRFITAEPYFDLWPSRKTPTHWVMVYRFFRLTLFRFRLSRRAKA